MAPSGVFGTQDIIPPFFQMYSIFQSTDILVQKETTPIFPSSHLEASYTITQRLSADRREFLRPDAASMTFHPARLILRTQLHLMTA
ncbi:hypothetical protein N7454_006333 [Penicillium verhagenii]|nr:hypothetical protein N7454_006333 [Penicillium verhagenii]